MLFAVVASTPVSGRSAELTVEITGLRNREGALRLALYDSPQDFLKESGMRLGLRVHVALLDSNPVVVSIRDLAPGRYALSVHHDEDMDGERDTLLRVPTEGFGFSNDARGRFGPPEFEDAAFRLGEGPLHVRVEMTYLP